MTLTEPASQITPREMDVLRLMCSGVVTDGELAGVLMVSENTAHYHIRQLFEKLDVHDRTRLVAYALYHGLVEFREISWRYESEGAA